MKSIITILLAALSQVPPVFADPAPLVKSDNIGLPAPKITETMCEVKGSNPVRKVACLVFETKDGKACRESEPDFAPRPELVCP
ncbi:hypothetical protein [Thiolapillus sp.]|uniref:hypothetical protein n=1 Tax=Thiolapillus sp. TaxID=2017437 RepID=UPI003AF8836E